MCARFCGLLSALVRVQVIFLLLYQASRSYLPHCKPSAILFLPVKQLRNNPHESNLLNAQEVHPSCRYGRWQSITYIRVDKANLEQIWCCLMIRTAIPYKNTWQELTMKLYLTSVLTVTCCHYLLHYRCNILYQLRLYSKKWILCSRRQARMAHSTKCVSYGLNESVFWLDWWQKIIIFFPNVESGSGADPANSGVDTKRISARE